MSSTGSALAELDVPEIQDVQKKSDESPNVKRLNINLAPKAFDEVQVLSRQTGRSMTELVRVGLSLIKIGLQANDRGLKLALVDENGRPVKEIVIA